MTSVLHQPALTVPDRAYEEPSSLISLEEQFSIEQFALREATRARHTPNDTRGIALSHIQMIADLVPDMTRHAFQTERAGWMLAKEAVRKGFEDNDDPEQFIAAQQGDESVKRKAAEFIEAAIDAYVCKRTKITEVDSV
jgi:hypothetical protein